MSSDRVRILVVDDNADMRCAVAAMLEHAGFCASHAADGNAAVRLQAANPAHVLVTDLLMPEKDGIETIAHFRRDFPDVRIIAMSGGGKARGEYFLAASAAGADAVLRKPFGKEDLLAALERIAPKVP